MRFKITDIPRISTLYYIKDNFICYNDLLKDKIQPILVDFNSLSEHSLTQNRLNSIAVAELIPLSLDNLQRVYHLASIVQRKHPVFPWDWHDQLFNAEVRARSNKVKMEYLVNIGRLNKTQTVTSSTQPINFPSIRTNDASDEILWKRVCKNLQEWVYY